MTFAFIRYRKSELYKLHERVAPQYAPLKTAKRKAAAAFGKAEEKRSKAIASFRRTRLAELFSDRPISDLADVHRVGDAVVGNLRNAGYKKLGDVNAQVIDVDDVGEKRQQLILSWRDRKMSEAEGKVEEDVADPNAWPKALTQADSARETSRAALHEAKERLKTVAPAFTVTSFRAYLLNIWRLPAHLETAQSREQASLDSETSHLLEDAVEAVPETLSSPDEPASATNASASDVTPSTAKNQRTPPTRSRRHEPKKGTPADGSDVMSAEEHRELHDLAVLGMGAVWADGERADEEVTVLRDLFRNTFELSEDDEKWLQKTLTELDRPNLGASDPALDPTRIAQKLAGRDTSIHRRFLAEFLFKITTGDGEMNEPERNYVRGIIDALDLPAALFDELERAPHAPKRGIEVQGEVASQVSRAKWIRDLNLPEDIRLSIQVVRRAYNRVMDESREDHFEGKHADYLALAREHREAAEAALEGLMALIAPDEPPQPKPSSSADEAPPSASAEDTIRHNPALDAIFG